MNARKIVTMTYPSQQKALEEQGWVKQFTTAEPRLSEVVELYQALGFEVHLEPMFPGEAEGLCEQCILAECPYQTVYTRKKRTPQE